MDPHLGFDFEPGLARPPPSRWYFDAAILGAKRERVFGRTWPTGSAGSWTISVSARRRSHS
jgi:hypothetical protein